MNIQPLRPWEKLLDIILIPIMRLVSGAPAEEPQRSHVWNVKTLTPRDVENLDKSLMVTNSGMSRGVQRSKIIPRHHIPIFGGWKNYIVISPKNPEAGWFIGWNTHKVTEHSRIELRTPVRMLVAPEQVQFFAFSISGEQIRIEQIGEGVVGDKSQYSKLPLL